MITIVIKLFQVTKDNEKCQNFRVNSKNIFALAPRDVRVLSYFSFFKKFGLGMSYEIVLLFFKSLN